MPISTSQIISGASLSAKRLDNFELYLRGPLKKTPERLVGQDKSAHRLQ